VVKDIFDMAFKQIGLNEIVRRLNAAKTPTPIDYARAKGLQGNYGQGNGLWNSRTVRHILANRTYTGDMVQGKDFFTVENTHESLVSRDVFDMVQKLLVSSSSVTRNTSNIPRTDNILRGKVICGACGGKMQRRKGSGNSSWHFFTCISNNRLGAGHCIGMYVRESDIMGAIHSEVDRYVQENEAVCMANENRITELTAMVSDLNNVIQTHKDELQSQYEKLVQGTIKAGDFELMQREGERLCSEFRGVRHELEKLKKEQEQFTKFRCVHLGGAIETVVYVYVKDVVVYKDKHVAISLCA
jgi:hypothetical protein